MRTLDLFCDVIDNFGDAGVCWRLARLLSKEERYCVRLYINRPETLAAFVPELKIHQLPQTVEDILICRWDNCLCSEPGDIVLETFGCRLPEAFEAKIAAKNPAPLWINLEYLSAEDWVEGCHGLPSPHPSLPAEKFFFFPGVTDKTGGIMIENDLAQRRTLFQEKRRDFLSRLNLDPQIHTVYVFCYPEAPLREFREALIRDEHPINVVMPQSAAAQVWSALSAELPADFVHTTVVPMVPQQEFDHYLWAADSLIIRGEDSFVRAQLAQKPFIWNIYPQTEETHIKKLKAFASRIEPYLGEHFDLWLRVNLAWNHSPADLTAAWSEWRSAADALSRCAEKWEQHLEKIGSLSKNLCKFIQLKLK